MEAQDTMNANNELVSLDDKVTASTPAAGSLSKPNSKNDMAATKADANGAAPASSEAKPEEGVSADGKTHKRAQRIFAGDFYSSRPPVTVESMLREELKDSTPNQPPRKVREYLKKMGKPMTSWQDQNTQRQIITMMFNDMMSNDIVKQEKKKEQRKTKDQQALSAILTAFTDPAGGSSSSSAQNSNSADSSSATERQNSATESASSSSAGRYTTNSTASSTTRLDSLASYIVNFQEEAMLQKNNPRFRAPPGFYGGNNGNNTQSSNNGTAQKSRSPKGRGRATSQAELSFNARAAQRKLDTLHGNTSTSSPKPVTSPVLQPVILSSSTGKSSKKAVGAVELPPTGNAVADDLQRAFSLMKDKNSSSKNKTGSKKLQDQVEQETMSGSVSSSSSTTADENWRESNWRDTTSANKNFESDPKFRSVGNYTDANKKTGEGYNYNSTKSYNNYKTIGSSAPGAPTAFSSSATPFFAPAARDSGAGAAAGDAVPADSTATPQSSSPQLAVPGKGDKKILTITRDPAAIYLTQSGDYLVVDEDKKTQAAGGAAPFGAPPAYYGGAAAAAQYPYGMYPPPPGPPGANPAAYQHQVQQAAMMRVQQQMASMYYANQYAHAAAMAQYHEAHAKQVAAAQAALIDSSGAKKKQASKEQNENSATPVEFTPGAATHVQKQPNKAFAITKPGAASASTAAPSRASDSAPPGLEIDEGVDSAEKMKASGRLAKGSVVNHIKRDGVPVNKTDAGVIGSPVASPWMPEGTSVSPEDYSYESGSPAADASNPWAAAYAAGAYAQYYDPSQAYDPAAWAAWYAGSGNAAAASWPGAPATATAADPVKAQVQ
ncbi:unnamed protein product [Amoebophrya sp. A120]|nr:unnamed protein product [Amoebophrya sp. A120]|eukprot:GSA120T00005033001.1